MQKNATVKLYNLIIFNGIVKVYLSFFSSVQLYSFIYFAFINVYLNSLLIINLQFLNDLMNHCYLIIIFMLIHSALINVNRYNFTF